MGGSDQVTFVAKPVRWSVGLSGLLDRSNHTGLGGQVVWSGISVRIPDQTAHLDRTYDSISITTEFIYGSCTNLEGYPRTPEPKGLSWPPQLRRKGVEGGAGAAWGGRFPLYCGPFQPICAAETIFTQALFRGHLHDRKGFPGREPPA